MKENRSTDSFRVKHALKVEFKESIWEEGEWVCLCVCVCARGVVCVGKGEENI